VVVGLGAAASFPYRRPAEETSRGPAMKSAAVLMGSVGYLLCEPLVLPTVGREKRGFADGVQSWNRHWVAVDGAAGPCRRKVFPPLPRGNVRIFGCRWRLPR
jgi:hypothetical protein